MKPEELTYEIARCYSSDSVVDARLQALVGGYLRSRNLPALANCTCHFDEASHSINEWRYLRQISAFFKKNAIFASEDDCFKRALHSFVDAESLCSETNRRLKPHVGYPDSCQEFAQEVNKMIRYISNVLGDYQTFINELPHLVKVTSGATAHSSRRNSLPQQKMRLKMYATGPCKPYLSALYRYYGFSTFKVKRTSMNRVELVPKNWKTHRTIACEPEGNLPFQLAFDTWAKRRLRRYGIDLSNQLKNQGLARAASISNDLATVDFEAASDTISYNTVSLVFPIDWFKYLTDVRTPAYRGKFGTGVYHKFSSMGNGSTFCIETLIFSAACYAVGSKRFSVYGDDVIIESELLDRYTQLTEFLGFRINKEKTFSHGPFRESCGGDFFNGINVTPVYIRNIDSRKAHLCHLCNTMASISRPNGKLEKLILSLIKDYQLPLVPFNGNTLSGIFIDPDTSFRERVMKRVYGIDRFKSYVPLVQKLEFHDSRGYYLWFLRRQVSFSRPWSDIPYVAPSITSTSILFHHKYVRKRVIWHMPDTGTPAHLLRWTELVLRSNAAGYWCVR